MLYELIVSKKFYVALTIKQMQQTLKNTLNPILRMGSFASFLYNKKENRQ